MPTPSYAYDQEQELSEAAVKIGLLEKKVDNAVQRHGRSVLKYATVILLMQMTIFIFIPIGKCNTV